MLILLTIFWSSFVIALSGALMPGPLLTVTISESARRGVRTGPLIIFGHGILELFLIGALLAGLAPILSMDKVFIGVSTAGGLVLLWMAISMLGSLAKLSLANEITNSRQRNLVFTGIMLSLVNPYWLIWWATIGLGYIIQTTEYGYLGLVAFFLGHISADLGWYALISFAIARGSSLLSDRRYRALIGACASFLLLFSGYFLYSGIKRLLLYL